jgi:hypothetical protein
MKFAKRLLKVAGAIALAGLFSVMFAPKAVRALASTLVTVSNTAVDPVLTQATDNPANTAVSLSLAGAAGDAVNFPGGTTRLQTSFQNASGTYTVPQGMRLVIDSLSAGVNFIGPGNPALWISFESNGIPTSVYMVLSSVNPGDFFGSFNFTAYVDPGTQITFNAFRSAPGKGSVVFADLYGHLVSVPASLGSSESRRIPTPSKPPIGAKPEDGK